MHTVSISKTASGRKLPRLPPHILEHHRQVLATIMKKRMAIEQWRRNVNVTEKSPESSAARKPPPSYQSRLTQEFSELQSALPTRLRPLTSDRVAIMANAMNYIIYLKNAIRQLQGEVAELSPNYVLPSTRNMTTMQAKTHKENCMLRMLSQVLPRISVMPSKIQLIEHATQTISNLETEYYHLLQAQRQRPEVSTGSSSASASRPSTPKELDARSVGSSPSERLPSIREILQNKNVSTDLRLPPLRFPKL